MATSGFQATATEQDDAQDYAVVKIGDLDIQKAEVGELGNRLPIGIWCEGNRLTEFTIHPYKTKHDRMLGDLLNRPKAETAKVLGSFLPQVIETIGGYEFNELASKMSVGASRLVQNMSFADALTLVIAVRLKALGPDIAMSVKCPNCGTQNDDNPQKGSPYHQLDTIEVGYIPDLNEPLVVEIELEDGIRLSKTETIKLVHMKPLRLFQIEKLAKPGQSAIDIEMLYATISALPDSDTYRLAKGQVFGQELYDELSMADLQQLRKAMETMSSIGPDITAPMDCINCGHEWDATISWGGGALRSFLYKPAEPPAE